MAAQQQRPLIFAHRGASAYAPENTLAAFELAIQQKADLIELDAKLSADQRVVIIHDRTLDRTTDGYGRVEDHTYAELQKFNASYTFQEQFPDERIPLLEEVLELCRGYIQINIELGNYYTPLDNLPEKVSSVINHYQLHDQVIVSAFHPLPLRKFHVISPDVAIGFLARKGWQGYLTRSWIGRMVITYDALHPCKDDVTPDLMHRARQYGYKVNTFTVNDPIEMAALISLGVDGIITDDPLTAHEVIQTPEYGVN
jgi:glycerophosphoryl diester phosphodiesterase